MDEINFEKLKDAVTDILTHHQMAVSKTGAKQVFSVLKKGKSTGYNEMNPAIAIDRIEFLEDPAAKRPTQIHKLDIVDFMIGMVQTQDLTPLILMNSFFNIISHPMPPAALDETQLMELLQNLNKEHFETGDTIMDRLKDGKFSADDARDVSKESMDLINAGAQLKYFSDQKAKKG